MRNFPGWECSTTRLGDRSGTGCSEAIAIMIESQLTDASTRTVDELVHVLPRRNFDGSMLVYRRESEALVRERHPTWNASRVEAEAKIEFEAAAK